MKWFQRFGNVEIYGKYDNEKLHDIIMESDIDLMFFSSVCPETFSYTLNDCFDAHIYPVAFDIGAIADRLHDLGVGSILPFDLVFHPEELMEQLYKIGAPG